MATPTILVASGTANTGANVVKQLSESGNVNVKALTRNPDSAVAKELAQLPHVTVVKGDFEDPASLKAALQDVSRAFLVSAPGDDQQYDREVAFIAAATEAKLEVVVRISTWAPLIDMSTDCVYAHAHARIEKYIEQHNSRVVDLQPNWFISNLQWQAAEAKATGKISYPMTEEQFKSMPPTAMIDARDVAGAAVAILLAPKEKVDELLAKRMLEVHGPEAVTYAQNLDAISKAAGKPLSFQYITPEEWVKMSVANGVPMRMATSFRDTILTVLGVKAPYRPKINETTPALAAIWKPQYTIAHWAKEYGSSFV